MRVSVQVTVTLASDGETSAVDPCTRAFPTWTTTGSSPLPTVTGVHSFTGSEAGGNTVDRLRRRVHRRDRRHLRRRRRHESRGQLRRDADPVQVPAFQDGVTTCDQDGSCFAATRERDERHLPDAGRRSTTPNGSSTTSSILPLYEGAIAFADDGVLPAPPGEEAAPAATEYDYVPTPTITSISTTNGPFSLASENGDRVVTIKGIGFNLAALDWVNFGDPTLAASQQFFSLVSVTGTEIQIIAPAFGDGRPSRRRTSRSASRRPRDCRTVNATYAGVSDDHERAGDGGPTAGTAAGPDTGGTPIDVEGVGLREPGHDSDVRRRRPDPFSFGTQYNFTANSDTDLTSTTVAAEPGDCRHAGLHGHGLLAADVRRQRHRRRVLPLSAGRSEDRLDHPKLRSGERRNRGHDHGREPRLRDQRLLRQRRPRTVPRTPRRCSTAARRTRSR